jgi:hypothetical protein
MTSVVLARADATERVRPAEVDFYLHRCFACKQQSGSHYAGTAEGVMMMMMVVVVFCG